MILLDSSAIVCAIAREAEWQTLEEILDDADGVLVGAPSVVESGIALTARGWQPHFVSGYLESLRAETLDFRKEHQSLALSAFARFGKGRHPARLNFGDCMTYAFASTTRCPLVYKGADFGQTDLRYLRRLD